MPIDLHIFKTLSDNCSALIRDQASGLCAAVDASDAAAIATAASTRGWTISHLFITHEHADHVQGAAELRSLTGCMITGPAAAQAGTTLDRIVGEGDTVMLGETAFDIWATAGHSPGHVSWISRLARMALVGDVAFVMGCGRLSGDTAPLMWQALSRLAALPDDTVLVTGHDYTASNAHFALAMEPGNPAIVARAAEAKARAGAADFWAVTTVGEEKATNPFMRARDGADFARLRQLKNDFRG